MSEPTNDPPLVTRPESALTPAVPVPGWLRRGARKYTPTWLQAALRWYEPLLVTKAWCGLFVATQTCGAVVGVVVVFTAYALAAPDPGAFATEQLAGFSKSVDRNPEGERPPVPFELGQALAWGMLSAQFTSVGLILLVLPKRIGPGWQRQIGVRRPRGLHVLLVLLLVPGFIIASDLVQTVFLMLTDMKPPPTMRALNSVFGQFPWPLTVLAVAIGPGVVEEFWCRGFLGRGLCARYGIGAGVVLTAVLFSAMHLDPSQLLVIALMGLYLHFVYLAARSIWVPILLHALNNGLAILLALAVKLGDDQGSIEVPVIVHLVGLSLVVFGSVALWTSRAELEPGAGGEPWEPESPGISTPPAGANARLRYAHVSPVALMFTLVSFAALMYLAFRFSG